MQLFGLPDYCKISSRRLLVAVGYDEYQRVKAKEMVANRVSAKLRQITSLTVRLAGLELFLGRVFASPHEYQD
jgi:hypothetical protein